jgi:hypothetical protein
LFYQLKLNSYIYIYIYIYIILKARTYINMIHSENFHDFYVHLCQSLDPKKEVNFFNYL